MLLTLSPLLFALPGKTEVTVYLSTLKIELPSGVAMVCFGKTAKERSAPEHCRPALKGSDVHTNRSLVFGSSQGRGKAA